jgi:hypothetical protein
MTTTTTTTLTSTPDRYSETYHYDRYPASIPARGADFARAGAFKVWSRDVERPNPEHVTWSPELVVLVAEQYQTPAWHAERAERAARPEVQVGELVVLGHLLVEVPARAAEYVDGVPCKVVGTV